MPQEPESVAGRARTALAVSSRRLLLKTQPSGRMPMLNSRPLNSGPTILLKWISQSKGRSGPVAIAVWEMLSAAMLYIGMPAFKPGEEVRLLNNDVQL